MAGADGWLYMVAIGRLNWGRPSPQQGLPQWTCRPISFIIGRVARLCNSIDLHEYPAESMDYMCWVSSSSPVIEIFVQSKTTIYTSKTTVGPINQTSFFISTTAISVDIIIGNGTVQ